MLSVPERGSGDRLINRDTLSDRSAERLRELILLGDLKPGQILAERELADTLGVSRTPLREALRLLAGEGLVEMAPNLRPRVAAPSLGQLLDLVDVLAALEGLAGERAAKRITDDEVDGLDKLVDQMAKFPRSGDELQFFRLDMSFHHSIVLAAGNASLEKTHAQYNAALFRARFMSTRWKARRPLMDKQHRVIAGCLRARDGTAAGDMLRAHLAQLKTNISELMSATVAP